MSLVFCRWALLTGRGLSLTNESPLQIGQDVFNRRDCGECSSPIAVSFTSNSTSGVNEIPEIPGKTNLTGGLFRDQPEVTAHFVHFCQVPILRFSCGSLR